MSIKITGTGSALPLRVVDNHELARYVDTSDEWIRTRTGIRSRHWAEKETTVSLGAQAAERALQNAGISPGQVDIILAATGSAEQIFPNISCEIQARIGAVSAACLDLGAACTGFAAALQMAAGQLEAGMAETVLVVAAECMSRLVDPADRSTSILFGDGAGAAVLQKAGGSGEHQSVFLLKADGTQGGALTCGSGRGTGMYGAYMQMDGRAIYQFAVKTVPELLEELMEKSGCCAQEIDFFLLHQANRRMIESIARHMKQPVEKFPMNLMETGNMSSASIPVLLDMMNRSGKLKRGMKLIMAAFGAGLTWGGAYLEW